MPESIRYCHLLTEITEFTDHQRDVFCVFSGLGVTQLRNFLDTHPYTQPSQTDGEGVQHASNQMQMLSVSMPEGVHAAAPGMGPNDLDDSQISMADDIDESELE
jgi:F-box and leucine-rich repeat protein GRR1